MANTKIKDLTEKATGAATDEFAINDVAGGNVDKKVANVAFLGTTQTFTKAQTIRVTGLPLFITDLSAATNTNEPVLDFRAETSVPMLNGFGGAIRMINRDDSGVDNVIATMEWEKRAGGDDDGELIFRTANNGTLADGLIIDNLNNVDIPNGDLDLFTNSILNATIALGSNTMTGTSAELATAISDETGSGALVFGTSPTLVTPVLGTPSSGTMTNVTGLPLAGLVNAAKEETWSFAISDNTTALTTGTKFTWYTPYAITLTDIQASVLTAPTDATLIIDVHEAGTTIMDTNKLDIETTEFHTNDAGTQPAISDTALAAGAKIEFIVDQIGSTVAGAGAIVYLVGFQT